MKILAIIPARGGSKSIPSKNIQKLGSLPLVAHTIKSAKESKLVNRIIVSTDNRKIAEAAKKYGADIPFIRPKRFAQDSSSTLDVVKHALQALQKLEGYTPDIVTVLLPTTPFRHPTVIDDSVRLLKRTNATSVISVHKTRTHPFKAFMPKNGFLEPFKRDYLKYYQRQKLPDFYHTTGAAYTFWYDILEKYGNYYGPRIKPLVSHTDEMNIDLDFVFDFFVAEMTLKYWKKYPKKFRRIV